MYVCNPLGGEKNKEMVMDVSFILYMFHTREFGQFRSYMIRLCTLQTCIADAEELHQRLKINNAIVSPSLFFSGTIHPFKLGTPF